MNRILRMPPMKIMDMATYCEASHNTIMDEIKKSNYVVAFTGNDKGQNKIIYTDISENEFLVICNALLRNIMFFNLFKLVLSDIENDRENPSTSNEFTYKCLDFIRLGKLKNLNLNF